MARKRQSHARTAFYLAPCIAALSLSYSQAGAASAVDEETSSVHKIVHSLAKSQSYSATTRGAGYKWGKTSVTSPATTRITSERGLSGGYKWGKAESPSNEVSTKAEQAGKRWGRAATSEQAGKRWGRAATSEQAGKRWGRAATSEQAGKRWGRAATSEQAGKRWGRAATSEQAGKRWGRG